MMKQTFSQFLTELSYIPNLGHATNFIGGNLLGKPKDKVLKLIGFNPAYDSEIASLSIGDLHVDVMKLEHEIFVLGFDDALKFIITLTENKHFPRMKILQTVEAQNSPVKMPKMSLLL